MSRDEIRQGNTGSGRAMAPESGIHELHLWALDWHQPNSGEILKSATDMNVSLRQNLPGNTLLLGTLLGFTVPMEVEDLVTS